MAVPTTSASPVRLKAVGVENQPTITPELEALYLASNRGSWSLSGPRSVN